MPTDRARNPKRVPFVNGVRVTPAGSHFEGSRFEPHPGEGLVPGGLGGAMIAERIHKENVAAELAHREKQNARLREEGRTPVVKINTNPVKDK